MDSALRLRVYALLSRAVLAVLYVRVVFPGTRPCYRKLAHNPDWNSARSTFMPTEMAPTLALTELLPFRESDVNVGGLPGSLPWDHVLVRGDSICPTRRKTGPRP
jgi:hypothetical protein